MGRPYGPQEWFREEKPGEICFTAEQRGYAIALDTVARDSAASIRASEERYRYTIALSPLIPWITDAHGGMIDIDVRGLDRTGLSYEDCLGSGFLAAIHAGDRAVVRTSWNSARKTGLPIDYEIRLRQGDGSYRWYRCRAAPRLQRGGEILCWYGTIEDIDDRKLADQALRWTSDHDDLTGLWNRRAFMAGLHKALVSADGTGIEVGLLLIDLDGFKMINDRFGHDAGDALLKQFAQRLRDVGCGEALAGRLGGDEFGLFIYTSDHECFNETIQILTQALAAPYALKGQAHHCRASIGVAIYPGHGEDADGLHKNADLALYEAKRGSGGARFFESAMRARLQTRLSELAVARHALDNDQVVPFYQPKVDLHTGAIVGFEALLRWTQGAHEMQSPGLISAALEDAELAIALDERILMRVTGDIARWQRSRLPIGRIAVNVSAAGFRQPDFADRVLGCVAQAGIDPHRLELEVTETVFLERGSDRVLQTFRRLRETGMGIALDDFGTGYASLVHLKQFPIDTIKIDRSFIQTLDDTANAAIVRAIVDLGRRLGITTVAEGVETDRQAQRLHRKGCDHAQGYLFSPAIPADRVRDLLASGSQWHPSERRSGKDRRTAVKAIR